MRLPRGLGFTNVLFLLEKKGKNDTEKRRNDSLVMDVEFVEGYVDKTSVN